MCKKRVFMGDSSLFQTMFQVLKHVSWNKDLFTALTSSGFFYIMCDGNDISLIFLETLHMLTEQAR